MRDGHRHDSGRPLQRRPDRCRPKSSLTQWLFQSLSPIPATSSPNKRSDLANETRAPMVNTVRPPRVANPRVANGTLLLLSTPLNAIRTATMVATNIPPMRRIPFFISISLVGCRKIKLLAEDRHPRLVFSRQSFAIPGRASGRSSS